MIEYDEELYEIEYDPDDCCPPKEEPDCGGCNDGGWTKPYGPLRRILARILPLCVVWWQWNGLLHRWGTLRGYWPCSGCNECWIDRLAWRLGRWRWRKRRGPAWTYDDEAPF